MMKCSYFAAGALAAIMTFAAPAPVNAQAGGDRVDLTYAADQMLSSVVYIKVTTKSKVQTMEYSSPFDDFFSDFFGRGNGGGAALRNAVGLATLAGEPDGNTNQGLAEGV